VSTAPEGIAAAVGALYEPTIAARLQRAATDRVAERIWAHDDALWGPAGQPEVSDRLGWLDVHDRLLAEVDDLTAFARQAHADGLREAVVLGMGGSSLAPEVFRRSFGTHGEGLILHVLDSTDADAVRDTEAAIDLDTALFVVSSKSGGTVETLSAFHYFWERTGGRGEQFVAVTDPGTSLEQLGNERGFRRVFLNDPDIGGRYSALSYFGIVPAALLGADLRALLQSAHDLEASLQAADPAQNPGLWLGCVLGELSYQGRDKLTFAVDPPIESFGLWVEQLIAESTGKHGRGILPVADEPLGAPEAYGNDRVFVHLHDERRGGAEIDDAVARLVDAGQPVITIAVHGAPDLGRIMLLFEFATAVSGWVLQINPFDQPDVQSAKDKTKEVLALDAPPDIPEADTAALKRLLNSGPPSYLAIQGYLAPSEEFDDEVASLRGMVRDRTTMATTFGYGPRYLHSTGQLHKGGPPVGRFLQLLHAADEDVPVPGESFTFETLKRAQADGDLLVLRDHGLPAERLVLRGDPVAALRTIKENL
jgi:glucose-6-phosphate isomerase